MFICSVLFWFQMHVMVSTRYRMNPFVVSICHCTFVCSGAYNGVPLDISTSACVILLQMLTMVPPWTYLPQHVSHCYRCLQWCPPGHIYLGMCLIVTGAYNGVHLDISTSACVSLLQVLTMVSTWTYLPRHVSCHSLCGSRCLRCHRNSK